MRIIAVICQVIVAAGVFNVWLVRQGRPTPWRPEGANNLAEEFRRYGFPDWVRGVVGQVKVALAVLLLVGIWIPVLAGVAAIAMVALMTAAVATHLRIGDPLRKSLPALSLLVLSSVVAYLNL